jgi:WD40 repeat protein
MWDATSGNRISTVSGLFHIEDCRLTPDERFLVVRENASAIVCDAATGEIAQKLRHSDLVTNFALSKDGTHLATISADFTTRVWNLDTAAASGWYSLQLPHHFGPFRD